MEVLDLSFLSLKQRKQVFENNNLTDILEYIQWNGGRLVIKQIFENHADTLMKIRQNVPANVLNLTSDQVFLNRKISDQLVDDVGGLPRKVKRVIRKTATLIEDKKFSLVENKIENTETASKNKERARSIITTIKKIRTSRQIFKITIEYFEEIIKIIYNEFNDGHPNMLFKNAILVYEITDYVVKFTDEFALSGYTDLMYLHKEIQSEINTIRTHQKLLSKNAKQDGIEPSVRNQVLNNIKLRNISLVTIESEWENLTKYVTDLKNVFEEIKNKTLALEPIRKSAKIQLMLLQSMEILKILRQNKVIFDEVLLLLKSAQLYIPSLEQVQQLLGLEHKES